MAFQAPTRQVVQRPTRLIVFDLNDHDQAEAGVADQQLQESWSWVLFSPPTDVTTTSYLSETERSLHTTGQSQLRHLGSLNTLPGWTQSAIDTGHAASSSVLYDISVEDDAELDSLDSHLPEFRSLPGIQDVEPDSNQQAMPVLPTHDGLGSFRLSSQPILGWEAQDQIYQFERFNPRRVRRRLDSFSRNQLDLEHGPHAEEEKRLRIEAWMSEYSRTVQDEAQRESRRRRRPHIALQRLQRPIEAEPNNMTWHDDDDSQTSEERKGLLTRITLTMIKDVLGIDERLLSLLLGGSLPEDKEPPGQSLLFSDQSMSVKVQESLWQLWLFKALSRELELFVNRLSHHPGAFSTSTHVRPMTLPYAGLPMVAESHDELRACRPSEGESMCGSSAPAFQPTMGQQQMLPVPGPGRRTEESSVEMRNEARTDNTFTQDEWERNLDLKLVFKYLISRFLGRSKGSSAANVSYASTSTTHDSAEKISRVRQHHPLMARPRLVERRPPKATMPAGVTGQRHSSCASQSTRRSARQSNCSSRHYWDLGGSMGTVSAIASHGHMGSWGEV